MKKDTSCGTAIVMLAKRGVAFDSLDNISYAMDAAAFAGNKKWKKPNEVKCHAKDPNNCRFHKTGKFADVKSKDLFNGDKNPDCAYDADDIRDFLADQMDAAGLDAKKLEVSLDPKSGVYTVAFDVGKGAKENETAQEIIDDFVFDIDGSGMGIGGKEGGDECYEPSKDGGMLGYFTTPESEDAIAKDDDGEDDGDSGQSAKAAQAASEDTITTGAAGGNGQQEAKSHGIKAEMDKWIPDDEEAKALWEKSGEYAEKGNWTKVNEVLGQIQEKIEAAKKAKEGGGAGSVAGSEKTDFAALGDNSDKHLAISNKLLDSDFGEESLDIKDNAGYAGAYSGTIKPVLPHVGNGFFKAEAEKIAAFLNDNFSGIEASAMQDGNGYTVSVKDAGADSADSADGEKTEPQKELVVGDGIHVDVNDIETFLGDVGINADTDVSNIVMGDASDGGPFATIYLPKGAGDKVGGFIEAINGGLEGGHAENGMTSESEHPSIELYYGEADNAASGKAGKNGEEDGKEKSKATGSKFADWQQAIVDGFAEGMGHANEPYTFSSVGGNGVLSIVPESEAGSFNVNANTINDWLQEKGINAHAEYSELVGGFLISPNASGGDADATAQGGKDGDGGKDAGKEQKTGKETASAASSEPKPGDKWAELNPAVKDHVQSLNDLVGEAGDFLGGDKTASALASDITKGLSTIDAVYAQMSGAGSEMANAMQTFHNTLVAQVDSAKKKLEKMVGDKKTQLIDDAIALANSHKDEMTGFKKAAGAPSGIETGLSGLYADTLGEVAVHKAVEDSGIAKIKADMDSHYYNHAGALEVLKNLKLDMKSPNSTSGKVTKAAISDAANAVAEAKKGFDAKFSEYAKATDALKQSLAEQSAKKVAEGLGVSGEKYDSWKSALAQSGNGSMTVQNGEFKVSKGENGEMKVEKIGGDKPKLAENGKWSSKNGYPAVEAIDSILDKHYNEYHKGGMNGYLEAQSVTADKGAVAVLCSKHASLKTLQQMADIINQNADGVVATVEKTDYHKENSKFNEHSIIVKPAGMANGGSKEKSLEMAKKLSTPVAGAGKVGNVWITDGAPDAFKETFAKPILGPKFSYVLNPMGDGSFNLKLADGHGQAVNSDQFTGFADFKAAVKNAPEVPGFTKSAGDYGILYTPKAAASGSAAGGAPTAGGAAQGGELPADLQEAWNNSPHKGVGLKLNKVGDGKFQFFGANSDDFGQKAGEMAQVIVNNNYFPGYKAYAEGNKVFLAKATPSTQDAPQKFNTGDAKADAAMNLMAKNLANAKNPAMKKVYEKMLAKMKSYHEAKAGGGQKQSDAANASQGGAATAPAQSGGEKHQFVSAKDAYKPFADYMAKGALGMDIDNVTLHEDEGTLTAKIDCTTGQAYQLKEQIQKDWPGTAVDVNSQGDGAYTLTVGHDGADISGMIDKGWKIKKSGAGNNWVWYHQDLPGEFSVPSGASAQSIQASIKEAEAKKSSAGGGASAAISTPDATKAAKKLFGMGYLAKPDGDGGFVIGPSPSYAKSFSESHPELHGKGLHYISKDSFDEDKAKIEKAFPGYEATWAESPDYKDSGFGTVAVKPKKSQG